MNAYSIWLDLEKESRVSYRKIISTLSKRLKSPLLSHIALSMEGSILN